ncbi:hypothetical protein DOM22_05140 [Bdellovibrio sp. ZAP7]|uniref:AAA family ATPase n=1 Tax=Bdellovibrio sp. ZAP7 TaxID=2231053 RepID=UPI00115A456F|nr:AAA family ATPase [Bdellovibrio sp. ZAP7]QDK44586.1 hypothetical protein DOM22_05140 [Bdellovibrio sp. ZAP7]
MSRNDFRVVLTGGPGGGKTTAAELFRREINRQIVIVPESATLLYSGGFPRSVHSDVRKIAQKAIYNVQLCLEEAQAAEYRSQFLLCDRGTVDGGAFWPGNSSEFFESLGTTLKQELARYDAVIFFETAAVSGLPFLSGNPLRIETEKEAVELDIKLRELWSQHENFIFIPHDVSFVRKVQAGLIAMQTVIEKELERSFKDLQRLDLSFRNDRSPF